MKTRIIPRSTPQPKLPEAGQAFTYGIANAVYVRIDQKASDERFSAIDLFTGRVHSLPVKGIEPWVILQPANGELVFEEVA